MTTQALKQMFPHSLSEVELDLVEAKLATAENKERAHKPLKKFPRNAL